MSRRCFWSFQIFFLNPFLMWSTQKEGGRRFGPFLTLPNTLTFNLSNASWAVSVRGKVRGCLFQHFPAKLLSLFSSKASYKIILEGSGSKPKTPSGPPKTYFFENFQISANFEVSHKSMFFGGVLFHDWLDQKLPYFMMFVCLKFVF